MHLFCILGGFRRVIAIASERFDKAAEGMKNLMCKGSGRNDLSK
jgi:hypothetical protein